VALDRRAIRRRFEERFSAKPHGLELPKAELFEGSKLGSAEIRFAEMIIPQGALLP
jgi:hypothetical protein